MATGKPTPIPFPLSTFPGANPQESAGRLVNLYAEPLGEGGPAAYKWSRSCGLTQLAATAYSGYRGGLIVNNLSFETWLNQASTVDASGNVTSIGNFPGSKPISIARNQALPTPDVVAVDLDNGAYVLGSATVVAAQATATVGGSSFVAADTVSLIILNEFLTPGFPVTLTHTLGGGETASTIAAALNTLLNANSVLSAANVSSTVLGAVITIDQLGSIGNATNLIYSTSGTGDETITFSPSSGDLAGGQGTHGAFTGVPTVYNGQGSLPQPNSVCFQDRYFFFTTGAGQVYATGINTLTMNALTFITVQAKADVTLLRGIAFSGFLLLFTTGSCEVWQDAAAVAPNFPYARVGVLEFGLMQPEAIAGFDTGFSELIWVAQDFSVHWMTSGQYGEIKVSPPDLDRLIEAAVRAGDTLVAGCYITTGKKFWHLSSSTWSWEFNLQTKKWNERSSLATSGVYGRWRAVCGHPAFNKWLVGDYFSGNILFADFEFYDENGMPQLFRIESGPVKGFPYQLQIARADFDFIVGVGQAVGNIVMNISGAAAGTGGVVRLTVDNTARAKTNDTCLVAGVTGTVEANGAWTITVIDATHIELQGSAFEVAYISGGTAIDKTTQQNVAAPKVAISLSKDGGLKWGNPLVRALGTQNKSQRQRVSVKHMGLPGPMGARWRLDVSDAVYTSLLGGTQASDPRSVGT